MYKDFIDRLSVDRTWRARELSDMRIMHHEAECERERAAVSRSIVVLSYAHWEGYCKNSANIFMDYLEEIKIPYANLPPDMFLGAVSNALDSYRDTADNLNSRKKLLNEFRSQVGGTFSNFDRRIILPRSNLNFERLQFICATIGADVQPFQKHRLKIDKELVKWRHEVAHGELFILGEEYAESHTRLCEELLFLTKDVFEATISNYN